MAQRLKTLYPGIMSAKFQPFIYDFQSTQVSRTGQSGVSFDYSLQQKEGHIPPAPQAGFQPIYIYSDTQNEDNRLRFFQNCPIYQSSVEVILLSLSISITPTSKVLIDLFHVLRTTALQMLRQIFMLLLKSKLQLLHLLKKLEYIHTGKLLAINC